MKLFYINLDRSTARREWFERQAERLGVKFTRIAAVDGAAVPEAEAKRLHTMSSMPLSAGEIGCLLSHRAIWKIVAEGEDEWAFVAEDDVHFSINAARFLTSSDWIPGEAELVKAETVCRRAELSRRIYGSAFGHVLRRLKSVHLGSGGYFVSRTGARRLLSFVERHCEPVDQVLFSSKFGILNTAFVLQLTPAICIQDIFTDEHAESGALASIIEAHRRADWDENKRQPRGDKAMREFARLGRQAKGALRLVLVLGSGRAVIGKITMAPLLDDRETR